MRPLVIGVAPYMLRDVMARAVGPELASRAIRNARVIRALDIDDLPQLDLGRRRPGPGPALAKKAPVGPQQPAALSYDPYALVTSWSGRMVDTATLIAKHRDPELTGKMLAEIWRRPHALADQLGLTVNVRPVPYLSWGAGRVVLANTFLPLGLVTMAQLDADSEERVLAHETWHWLTGCAQGQRHEDDADAFANGWMAACN